MLNPGWHRQTSSTVRKSDVWVGCGLAVSLWTVSSERTGMCMAPQEGNCKSCSFLCAGPVWTHLGLTTRNNKVLLILVLQRKETGVQRTWVTWTKTHTHWWVYSEDFNLSFLQLTCVLPQHLGIILITNSKDKNVSTLKKKFKLVEKLPNNHTVSVYFSSSPFS